MKNNNQINEKSPNLAKRVLGDGYLTANELRIGNLHEYYILDKSDPRKEWWEVSTCDANDLVYLENNPKDVDFKPIPLAEDWLLNFGFTKEKEFYFYIKQGIEVFFDTENKVIKVLFKGYLINNIEFIHQLQNLYFALTAIELTIS